MNTRDEYNGLRVAWKEVRNAAKFDECTSEAMAELEDALNTALATCKGDSEEGGAMMAAVRELHRRNVEAFRMFLINTRQFFLCLATGDGRLIAEFLDLRGVVYIRWTPSDARYTISEYNRVRNVQRDQVSTHTTGVWDDQGGQNGQRGQRGQTQRRGMYNQRGGPRGAARPRLLTREDYERTTKQLQQEEPC